MQESKKFLPGGKIRVEPQPTLNRFVEPFLAQLEESRLTERQRELLGLLRRRNLAVASGGV